MSNKEPRQTKPNKSIRNRAAAIALSASVLVACKPGYEEVDNTTAPAPATAPSNDNETATPAFDRKELRKLNIDRTDVEDKLLSAGSKAGDKNVREAIAAAYNNLDDYVSYAESTGHELSETSSNHDQGGYSTINIGRNPFGDIEIELVYIQGNKSTGTLYTIGENSATVYASNEGNDGLLKITNPLQALQLVRDIGSIQSELSDGIEFPFFPGELTNEALGLQRGTVNPADSGN